MHVTMDGGIAVVWEELALEVSGPQSSVHTLRLAVPAMAELVALEACQAGACLAGSDVSQAARVCLGARYGARLPGSAPLVLASRDGQSIEIAVAGLEIGTAVIRLAWSAATERLAGIERLRMPPRSTPTEITLASASLDRLSVDGDPALTETPTNRVFDLLGVPRAGAPTLELGRIDEQGMGFLRVSAPATPAPARPLVVFVDASPSAQRSQDRMRLALSMLFDATPDGSLVTVVAFARHARAIAEEDVATLRRRGVAIPTDVGPSTSLREVLAYLPTVPPNATLVWLGDGALGPSGGERDVRLALEARGLREIVVSAPDSVRADGIDPIGDRLGARAGFEALFSEVAETRVGDRIVRVNAGQSVLVPLRSIEDAPTTAVLSVVPALAAAPIVRGTLGLTPPRALLTLDPRDRDAAHKAARGQPAPFVGGGGLVIPRYSRRYVRVPRCSWRVTWGRSSRETLTRMMTNLRAPVRGCFAAARHGDPHYEARATFVLTLADDELAAADVETDDPELRACLMQRSDPLGGPGPGPEGVGGGVVGDPFVARARAADAGAGALGPDTAELLDATFASESFELPMSLLGPSAGSAGDGG